MKSGLGALIFDMDGVLINSEPLWRRAEIETFAGVGLMLEDADCFQTQGLRIDEAVAFWYECAPWKRRSPEEVSQAIVRRVAELIRIEGQPMPGALTAIDWISDSNWRLGLASSSSISLIETVLDRFDIAPLFECICSAEDEKFGKPDPGVYLSAARALGLNPRVCVAIEDSVHGMDSALSAGMRCIVIAPPETRDDTRFETATLRLDSLRDLPDALAALDETPLGGI